MKVFSEMVLKKGIALYNNGNIVKIDIDDEKISADIRDGRIHHVVYSINDKNKVSSMSCTCQLGKPCRHEAALMYAIKEDHLLDIGNDEEVEEIYKNSNDLIDLYNNLSKTLKTRRGINNAFNRKIKEMLSQIIDDAAIYSEIHVITIDRLRENLEEIDFLNGSERGLIIDLFLDAYHELMKINDQYVLDILTSLSYECINDPYSRYIELYKVEQYSLILKELRERIIQSEAPHKELVAYFHVCRENKVNYTQGLTAFIRYQDYSEYEYFMIKDLLDQEKFYDAKVHHQAFIESHGEVEDDPIMKKIDLMIKEPYTEINHYIDETVEDMYNRTNVQPIKKMEERFGPDWNLYKKRFYSRLENIDGKTRFYQVLRKMNEWEYMVNIVVDRPYFSNLFDLSDDIESYSREMYLYLYILCLEKTIDMTRNYYYDYERIGYYLSLLQRHGYEEYVYEIIYYLMKKYEKKNPDVVDYLDELSQGGLDNETQYY